VVKRLKNNLIVNDEHAAVNTHARLASAVQSADINDLPHFGNAGGGGGDLIFSSA